MLHLELNLDGLPGPTHGFGGLSHGNLASTSNKTAVSNPRAAALQGLEKMRLVASMGVPQAILPPHPRPNIGLLRRLGFTGKDAAVVEKAWKADPQLLLAASSSSAMWTANAATICPSVDSSDGRLHITPANLANQFHRSQEADHTAHLLRQIFREGKHFAHHTALPCHASLGDEGAANHIRLGFDGVGVQLFVHGDAAPTYGTTGADGPQRYPARQTLRASQSVARANDVIPDRVLFLQQSPAAIDAGAFHNDVVSVGSADVLVLHEQAFTITPEELRKRLPEFVHLLTVSSADLSLEEAVTTYLFNSQLIPSAATAEFPDGTLTLIAPIEVHNHPRARAAAERLVGSNTRLQHIHYIDLTQSMRNGGGPACLRLRVPITKTGLADVDAGVLISSDVSIDGTLTKLSQWVNRWYRDALRPQDLPDPQLLSESKDAIEQLYEILGLSLDPRGWLPTQVR